MEEIKINKLTCCQCGWMWTPRKEKIYVCPHCKSYKWDEVPEDELQEPEDNKPEDAQC